MKVGDKVRITRVEKVDEEHTNLKIGDIGVIEKEDVFNSGDCDDIYYINFGEGFVCKSESGNCDFSTNNYAMWEDQLELIEEET